MSTQPIAYLVVDGHSVMHAWPELRRDQIVAARRHLARTELLKTLRNYQDMTDNVQVVVVFDGTQSKVQEEREQDGLQIIYASSSTTADNIIERIAARYGKTNPMRVVSADGMVRETTSAFGADWCSPEMLKILCEDAEKAMRKKFKR